MANPNSASASAAAAADPEEPSDFGGAFGLNEAEEVPETETVRTAPLASTLARIP